MRRRRALFALVCAALAALTFALASAPSAAAGIYRAVQCNPGLGAGHADAGFSRTADTYKGTAECLARGLRVTHEAAATRADGGSYGAWTLRAPAGAAIIRAGARVSARGDDWHSPQMRIGLADGARAVISGVRGTVHTVRWAGDAGRTLVARLICTRASRCGRGEDARIQMRRVSLLLRDTRSPRLTLGGSLLAPGTRRGPETLTATGADAGGGVRSVTVELNGDPLTSHSFDCALAGTIALRLRPCPSNPTASFSVPTAGHFGQGPNRVRVCAADYAPNTSANSACAVRSVRIDNLCPVSPVAAGSLSARFRGGADRRRVRRARTGVVGGRLTSATGGPVAGATVCIATRTSRPGASEFVVATPTTRSDGTFDARLPVGPSRHVRVAHWPDEERALERYLKLTARAVPRLRLRPRRTLANGERLHFRIALPGPAAAGRRVFIQARAGRRWIRIAGGRTGNDARWRGSYRFRSTTGRRRYAFRAVVRRQAGYPYAGGRSRVRQARVVGR